MSSVYSDVHRRGGIARTYELLRDGHTSHGLTAAVRSGAVNRVRQGHYACPDVPDDEQRAVRVGGRLAGLAGARSYGIWTPPHARLHIAVPVDARALRTTDDPGLRLSTNPDPALRVNWIDRGASGTRTRLSAMQCLQQIVRSETPIVAFAAAESALHLGIVSKATVRRLGPLKHANAVSRLSESGGESLLKFGLLSERVRFRQQTEIAGVGRVDFVLGARLVVEVDGSEFHTSRETFEEDRRRDAVLAARGYRVLRFSYRQVERRWSEVFAAVAAVLARGDHL